MGVQYARGPQYRKLYCHESNERDNEVSFLTPKHSADKILEERLSELNRRANELTYEQRIDLLMEIDREYRESTEGTDDRPR